MMKKIIICLISLILSSTFIVESENVDINIEKSIEIFGTEEKPRIIFLLPEYNPEFKPFKTEKKYLLKLERVLGSDLLGR